MRSSSNTSASRRQTTPIWGILYSKWFGVALFTCLVVGTIAWFVVRERLPRTIRIATAARNGQYYLCGEVLESSLEIEFDRNVEVLVTEGSVANLRLLEEGKADLAIIQHGAVPIAGLAVIAPLYDDVVHVVARKGSGIQSIRDLLDRTVVLGPDGSGMQASALNILDHYGAKPKEFSGKATSYFMELANDEDLDAAIVTTGYVNSDLKRLLKGGEYELLSVDDAEAISIRHAHMAPTTIPRGLYREGPAVPDRPIMTVAATAILVASSEVPDLLVAKTVAALYEEYPRLQGGDSRPELPRLMTAADARQWSPLPVHHVTQAYFEPYKGLVLLKDFMESMVAGKDLIFTLGAGIYVLWLWRRKVVKRNNEAALAVHLRRLNTLLDETTRIESEQMKSDDPHKLREYLDEVTRIKLRALDELTDEDLRGDQMFAIFLAQCSNLSRKIQLKISFPGESSV